MSLSAMSLYMANLVPNAQVDLNTNYATPKVQPGALSFTIDAMGFRIFRYVKNVHSAALVIGDVAVRATDVTFTTAALTLGTRVTTTGLTADAHPGKLLIVEGNDTSAGAAPEGETGVIVKNSATVVDIDPKLPFSVTAVADVDCRISTPGWHVIQGGATAAANIVKGVVIGVDGISVGYYGWLQVEGYCPQAKYTAAAVTALANVVTGASGTLATISSAKLDKVVGYAPGTIESTHPGKMPVVLTLLSNYGVDAAT